MTSETLKIRLEEAARNSDGFVSEAYDLVEELENPPSKETVMTIIRFMEQNPDLDYGARGPLDHYIERLELGTYSRIIIDSVRMRPTMHTVCLLNSCTNALKATSRSEALAVLKAVANDATVGDLALSFLTHQQKVVPDPDYFVMQITFGHESRTFFSFSDFEKLLDGLDFTTDKSFWLTPGQDEYPCWNMIRRNDLVYLHFFPSRRNAGTHLRSASSEMITFRKGNHELEIQEGSLINPVTAVRVLRQYFERGTLAADLDWEEL